MFMHVKHILPTPNSSKVKDRKQARNRHQIFSLKKINVFGTDIS